MKKRWFRVLSVIVCVLCLTACSKQDAPDPNTVELTQEQEQQWFDSASQFIFAMDVAVRDGSSQAQADDPVYGPAFSGWENALSDIGEVQDITGKSCNFTKKDGTVTMLVKGSRHDADVVFNMEQKGDGYSVTGITTNVDYSMGEKMQQAGLNTLLGMFTTFFILILLAVVITVFGKVVGDFMEKTRVTGKREKRGTAVRELTGSPAVPPVVEEQDQTDDLALVAVITAAIAAYEGKAADNFVVRSIRKSRMR